MIEALIGKLELAHGKKHAAGEGHENEQEGECQSGIERKAHH
ncbi:hypothetical protein [Thalassovita aquimarina]|nr:hypothetical protein [Thalassovita aquimarina]